MYESRMDDKFQLFQFSFSSVAYIKIVCPSYGGPDQKKRYGQTEQTETQIRSEVTFNGKNLLLNLFIKRSDGTI
jgi:hypothetical protein